MTQIRRIATTRDDLIIEERKKSTGSASANQMLQDMTDKAPAAE